MDEELVLNSESKSCYWYPCLGAMYINVGIFSLLHELEDVAVLLHWRSNVVLDASIRLHKIINCSFYYSPYNHSKIISGWLTQGFIYDSRVKVVWFCKPLQPFDSPWNFSHDLNHVTVIFHAYLIKDEDMRVHGTWSCRRGLDGSKATLALVNGIDDESCM